mmetsp:Transcript_3306/g.5492  ORF Transcript_3306/g.5492 Transcript_3306/m.5492 type:complete len:146 (+) Transcript_3306:282-719(+)
MGKSMLSEIREQEEEQHEGSFHLSEDPKDKGKRVQKLLSYLVMPMLGPNLETVFGELNNHFSEKTVAQIGISILTNLQLIHYAGYTYNDLKLDNILVGNSQGGELNKLRLIDFGFAAKYRKSDGRHYKEDKVDSFKGNMIFASIN